MVIKMDYGQVLGRPAEHFADFAKTTKVFLDCVLLVEDWRHIPALDGGAVSGRLQAIRALPAYGMLHRGCGFRHWVWGFC